MIARAPRLLAVLLVLLPAPAAAAGWYERYGRAPNGSRAYICHGYGCRIVTPVTFSAAELARIAAPLRGRADAAAERAALAQAVQEFERIVGARVGTDADLAGMQFGGGQDDQMDCIDEATNTTSLLTLLEEQRLLRHHRVLQPVARGFFLDGRYPHATAVVAEMADGSRWAIDSWPEANARPPLIQKLEVWYRGRGAPPA